MSTANYEMLKTSRFDILTMGYVFVKPVPHNRMRVSIPLYNKIQRTVQFVYDKLKLFRRERTKGRKLAIPAVASISSYLFKQKSGIETKKATYEILKPRGTYKTFVVNLNRVTNLSLLVLLFLMRIARGSARWLKITDATAIPVCLNKNANSHRTMKGLASWGHTGNGWFYGLKLHITVDAKRKLLAITFSSGNIHDKTVFIKLNQYLYGVFVADAGYTSERMAREFYQEGKRILFAKPRKNMGKLMTWWQDALYQMRMIVEIPFNVLKRFHNLVSSLHRSVNGYLSNYSHSLLAYVLV